MEFKKIFLIGLIFIFFIYIVNAEPSFTFKQNDEVDLKIPCYNDNYTLCDNTTTCSITILYPNNSLLIDNHEMDYNTAYFNYTIPNNILSSGEYSSVVTCSGAYNGFSTFNFDITPTGNQLKEGQGFASMGLIIIIALLSFLFTWFGFKILDSDSEGAPSIAMFFLFLAMITAIYSLQLGYLYSTNILYNLGIGSFQFTFLLVILWGLIGITFVLLLFLLIKTLKMFANKGKAKDGWDNNKY